MAMEPTPPTPLQLSPLLQNLTTWLTPPDLSTTVAPAVGTSAGPAGAASNALRQAGGLLGLLPGRLASTAEENLPGLPTSESKPPKRVRCKCAEAYGELLPLNDTFSLSHAATKAVRLPDFQAKISTWAPQMARSSGIRSTPSAPRRYASPHIPSLPASLLTTRLRPRQDPYTLRHRHTLFPKRSVDRIFLLPTINKCLVLSGKRWIFQTPLA